MPLFFTPRTKVLLLTSSLFLLSVACNSDKQSTVNPDTMVSNDFESLAGWIGATPNVSLTKEKAHSGNYSIKVDNNVEYSLSFNSTLGALHEVRVKRIKISAWVFVPNDRALATFVTHAGDNDPSGKPLVWDGFDVVKAADGKYNQWVEVNKIVDIPEAAVATTTIGFYLWRSGGTEAVYLDDLTVSAEPAS